MFSEPPTTASSTNQSVEKVKDELEVMDYSWEADIVMSEYLYCWFVRAMANWVYWHPDRIIPIR